MASGYCDRSAELLLCAQLLRQKVMSGRTMLKPRKSRPGAVDTYFASTLFKTQFLPLINQVSTSLTLGQVKMNQLVSLTHRFSTACSPDATLAHSICKLVQELQPNMTTISTNLHHVAGVSSQVQMEFVSHPQFCKHVKALVTTQCARLAELSRRLGEFMEANRTLFSHEYFEPPGIDAPSPLPPTTASSSVLRLQARAKRSPELHFGEGLGADVDPLVSDSQHIQPQQQQQMVVRQREATSSMSATEIRQTEATIVQLGQMYEQFAFLVREQADVVMRIDGNVEDATANVDWAHGNLIEFMRHVSGRRSLMFKFFAVLLAIFFLLLSLNTDLNTLPHC